MEDYVIDFDQLLGTRKESSVAYMVCYIESEALRTNLLMKVGSDEQSKVYLNGKEIYRCSESRAYFPDQDTTTGVRLEAGLNVLVFKIANEILHWKGSVRFTDSAGRPVNGIRVTLSPP